MPLYPAQPSADQPLVQARRTTAFTLGGAFADIDLDATDVQNDAHVVEHTAADKITVKVPGAYEVSYGCTAPAGAQTTSLRVRKNDASTINGSEAAATAAGDAENISRQFIADLAASDFITIQAMSSAGAPDIAAGLTVTITHLAGQKGDPGAAGVSDVDAVHVNVGNEIALIADKPVPAAGDYLIIEDSAAGNIKKSLMIGNLPGGVSLSDVDPVNVTKAAAAHGVAVEASRQDHKHDVTTATTSAGSVAVGNAAAEGAGTALSRSTHQHEVTRGTPVAVGTANNAGAGTDFVGGDHVHAGLTRGANDFIVFAAKATPVSNDVLLIEDSAAAGAKANITVGALSSVLVPLTRTLTAGAGLTGGGDLSANRTLDVVANADGSITVNANDIQVGVLASDVQHGLRGGGTQHAVAVAGVSNGFLSLTDKTKLDGIPTSATSTTTVQSDVGATTASAADVLMTGMTITPGAGTYLVIFSGDVWHNLNAAGIFTNIYAAGALQAGTERHYIRPTALTESSFCCTCKVTVLAGQAIEGRWRTTAATANNDHRMLVVMRVQ
jgi:hypothetical protein